MIPEELRKLLERGIEPDVKFVGKFNAPVYRDLYADRKDYNHYVALCVEDDRSVLKTDRTLVGSFDQSVHSNSLLGYAEYYVALSLEDSKTIVRIDGKTAGKFDEPVHGWSLRKDGERYIALSLEKPSRFIRTDGTVISDFEDRPELWGNSLDKYVVDRNGELIDVSETGSTLEWLMATKDAGEFNRPIYSYDLYVIGQNYHPILCDDRRTVIALRLGGTYDIPPTESERQFYEYLKRIPNSDSD